jgi:hypothetical protein
MYDVLDKQSPGWAEPYLATLRHKPKDIKKKLQKQLDALPEDSN